MSTRSPRDSNRNYSTVVEVDPFGEPPTAERDKEYSEPLAHVTLNGRNVEVPQHFRTYLCDKLARLEKLNADIRIFDVELYHERNRRQSKSCQRVQITVRGRGAVARAEARADNFYGALEVVLDKLASRLRRAADRRKVHYGNRRPVSVAEATAPTVDEIRLDVASRSVAVSDYLAENAEVVVNLADPGADDRANQPGTVVRIKEHPATPMSVDAALSQMELVGHDFFLFFDQESQQPSVVYRRHAFDYGLIRLG